jgi:hypothetical protein
MKGHQRSKNPFVSSERALAASIPRRKLVAQAAARLAERQNGLSTPGQQGRA